VTYENLSVTGAMTLAYASAGLELLVQVNFKKGGHASFIRADLTDEIRRYVAKHETLNPGSTVH